MVNSMKNRDSKEKVKELKYEIGKMRHNSDISLRQGQSKIDRNAELEAARFR